MEYFKIAADMGNEMAQKRFYELQEKITPKKHEEVTADSKETKKESTLDKSFSFYKTAEKSKDKAVTELTADKEKGDKTPSKDTNTTSIGGR